MLVSNTKYLDVNLKPYVQDLCEEVCEALIEEVKEDPEKCRLIPCFLPGSLGIVKMSALPNTIDRFKTILVKVPLSYFLDIDKLIPKFGNKGHRLKMPTQY